jgi:heat-inducible transcriptional repressor
MAIVTVPRASSLRFKHIQLVYLQDFLVLMVIVLQEARLLRRILPLEVSATQLQLTQAADELNESLGGLNFSEIEARNMENSLLGELVKKNTVGMLREAETTVALEHHVDGLRLLLSQPEFSRGDQAKDLVEMVEEKVLLESVLSMVPRTGEVAVFIGEENLAEALRPFGVILCQYGIPQQVSGTICVIGPTRMSYAGAISGVRFLSSFMSGLVLELHGG